MESQPEMPAMYRTILNSSKPFVRGWGRMTVSGLDLVPPSGPLLVAGNHDSYWDPLAIGLAMMPCRQIQALAKASLWDVPIVGAAVRRSGQIPIDRGSGDRDALATAEACLRAGSCIGVFIEGTRSLGRELRARSGLGHLARDVPEAKVVCCAATGTVGMPRLGSRPKVHVEFFLPTGGGIQDGEEPRDFCQRLLDEIREKAPRDVAGRKHRAAAARGDAPQ